jgi:hypothetical protein
MVVDEDYEPNHEPDDDNDDDATVSRQLCLHHNFPTAIPRRTTASAGTSESFLSLACADLEKRLVKGNMFFFASFNVFFFSDDESAGRLARARRFDDPVGTHLPRRLVATCGARHGTTTW